MSKLPLAWESMAARVGKGATPPVTTPSVNPIYQTSVFTFDSLEQVDAALLASPVATCTRAFIIPTMRSWKLLWLS